MARKVLIQIRRGLEKDIGTLEVGELGFCTDTSKLYIGTVTGNTLLVAAQTVGDMLKSIYDTNNNGKVDSAEVADSVAWVGVTGKPSTFAPTTHSHTKAQISDFPTSLPASGGDSATVNGKTVDSNVPAGAKFTDTVYTHPDTASVRHVTDTEKVTWNAKETPAGAQAKANVAEANAKTHANTISAFNIADTRSVNSPPSFYQTRQIYNEFKFLATLVLPAVGGTYCTLITDGRWTGSSGGQVNQTVYTDAGRIFVRVSTSTTAWGEWKELATKGPVTWNDLKGV